MSTASNHNNYYRTVPATSTRPLHRYTAAGLYLKLIEALADSLDLQQDDANEIRCRLAEGLRVIEHIYDPADLFSTEYSYVWDNVPGADQHPDLELSPDITPDFDELEVSHVIDN